MTTLVTVDTHYNKIRSANAFAIASGLPGRRLTRATDVNVGYFIAISATMEASANPVSGYAEMITDKPKGTIRFTNDPVFLSMSDTEYLAALEALSGSLPDDNVRESIDEMNAIWRDRLNDIYDAVNEPDTHN